MAGATGSNLKWMTPTKFCGTSRPLGKYNDGSRTWLYCDEDGDGIVLDSESMGSDDIVQGSVGDCYFLAALAAAVSDCSVATDLIDETFEDVGTFLGETSVIWRGSPCRNPGTGFLGFRILGFPPAGVILYQGFC